MKKHKALYACSAMILLAGCSFDFSTSESASIGSNPYNNSSSSEESTSYSSYTSVPVLSVDSSSHFSPSSEDTPTSDITDLEADNISFSDSTFTISGAGTFEFSGNFNGNIIVNAGDDDEVEIVLNNFTISSSTNSPILCTNADELKVKLQKGSSNYIYDNRAAKTEDDEEQGNGAIYSKCDTKITGKGSLEVVANYNNGIHSTKDLEIKPTAYEGSKVQIAALNNALKGNDSFTMESGNIIAISTGGDGIKTEDTDVSDKGNQRGNVTITGGQLDIYSCLDGIQAAYNLTIETGLDDDSNVTTPIINIFTNKYSSYSGEVADISENQFYLATSSYSESYRFACLFADDEGNETWKNASYKSSISSGGGGRNKTYYYSMEKPENATKLKVYRFATSVTENDASKATACSESFITINENYDTLKIDVGKTSIYDRGWTSYTSSANNNPGGGWGGPGGGMQEGNNEKAEYSAKGLKADNVITINAGNINIKAYDDAIHANYGETFDNTETGLGDVVINGGSFSIYASDDGIHADRYLTINGGSIDVTNAYEAIEGNYITFAGGYTKVYATDDGVNAANKAGLTPTVSVTGGTLDVTVSGGDVDGIDSNGKYIQTGGIVVTKGANSNMSTGLDTDKGVSISSGTLIIFGRPESSPSTSGNVKSKTISGSYSTGTYLLSCSAFELTTTTKYSYSQIYLYSDVTTELTITKQ